MVLIVLKFRMRTTTYFILRININKIKYLQIFSCFNLSDGLFKLQYASFFQFTTATFLMIQCRTYIETSNFFTLKHFQCLKRTEIGLILIVKLRKVDFNNKIKNTQKSEISLFGYKSAQVCFCTYTNAKMNFCTWYLMDKM